MTSNFLRIGILLLCLSFFSCKKGNVETDDLKSQYSLELFETINLSAGNTLGIASGQLNFWILTGEQNGSQHELMKFDPTTNSVVEYFTLDNLTGGFGTGVHGITWDGTYIWILIDGNDDELVRFNPQNGMIEQVIQIPETLGVRDLEWGGNKFWITSGSGEAYSFDPIIGTTQLLVNRYDPNEGIAFRNNELWVGDLNDKDIHIYSSSNGAYQGVIENELLTNGEFCFHSGKLAVITDWEIRLYTVVQ